MLSQAMPPYMKSFMQSFDTQILLIRSDHSSHPLKHNVDRIKRIKQSQKLTTSLRHRDSNNECECNMARVTYCFSY